MRPLSARLISMDSTINEHFAWHWQGDQSYKVVPWKLKNHKTTNGNTNLYIIIRFSIFLGWAFYFSALIFLWIETFFRELLISCIESNLDREKRFSFCFYIVHHSTHSASRMRVIKSKVGLLSLMRLLSSIFVNIYRCYLVTSRNFSVQKCTFDILV